MVYMVHLAAAWADILLRKMSAWKIVPQTVMHFEAASVLRLRS
jgi:hypothetical protein